MALQFTVVRRKDMRKNAAADSKLFYGQTKASMKMDFDKFCEAVGDYCTASSADVKAVLDATNSFLRSRKPAWLVFDSSCRYQLPIQIAGLR